MFTYTVFNFCKPLLLQELQTQGNTIRKIGVQYFGLLHQCIYTIHSVYSIEEEFIYHCQHKSDKFPNIFGDRGCKLIYQEMFPNLQDFYLYIRSCFQIYLFASLPPYILGNLSEFVLTVYRRNGNVVATSGGTECIQFLATN